MKNKLLIIGNWKCNPTSLAEVERLFANTKKGIKAIKNLKGIEIAICPPFVYLDNLKIENCKLKIQLGAQDCFWEEKGPYTGEVSAKMLRNLECKYVIIGHSERREYFGETNEVVNKKLLTAFRARLKPILCVGEKEGEDIVFLLRSQLIEGLKNINRAKLQDLIIAYEPVWAIGTGNFCQPDEALRATLFIRQTLTRLYNRKLAEEIPVLYGGSVNSKNAKDYIKIGMNGLLIGGASLDSAEFVRIIRKINSE